MCEATVLHIPRVSVCMIRLATVLEHPDGGTKKAVGRNDTFFEQLFAYTRMNGYICI